MPREQLDHRVGGGMSRNKRPPLIKSAGCCLMLDPHYSSSSMYLGDEGTYVCKAFSPRSYVIQKVANSFFFFSFSILCVWSAVCLADPVRGCLCRAGLRVGGGKRRIRSIHVVDAVEGRAMSGGWKRQERERERICSIQGATGNSFFFPTDSESHEWSNRRAEKGIETAASDVSSQPTSSPRDTIDRQPLSATLPFIHFGHSSPFYTLWTWLFVSWWPTLFTS